MSSPAPLSDAPETPSASAPPGAPPTGIQPTFRADLRILVFLGICALLMTLGRPLWDADESRYAEIPREMLVHQQWLIPTLDGFTYLEKPPLNYWPTMLLYRVFGVHAACARVVPGLYFIGTLLVVYSFVRRVLNRDLAYFAAGMLLFQPLFLIYGQHLLTDGPLTFWLTLALTSLGRLRLDPDPRPRDAWLFWLGCLGAFFTKALVGLGFPLGLLFLDLVLRRGAGSFRRVRVPFAVGGLVVFSLCALWLIQMDAAVPHGYYHYFFVTQHLDRFAGGQHGGNWFLGLVAWLIFSWPWWPLLWPMLKSAFKALAVARRVTPLPVAPAARSESAFAPAPPDWQAVQSFLLLWGGAIYGFFAISRGQLLSYYLPAVPPFLILLAIQFHLAPGPKQAACVKLGWLSGWLFVVGAVGLMLSTGSHFTLQFEMTTGPLARFIPGMLLMTVTVLFYLILGYRFLPRQPDRDPLIPYAGLMLVGLFTLQVIGPNQSSAGIAQDPLVVRLLTEHPDCEIVHWSDHTPDADRAAGLYFDLKRDIVHVGSGMFPSGQQVAAELVYCIPHTDPAYTARMLYPDWPAYLAAHHPKLLGGAPAAAAPARQVLLIVPRNREADLPKDLPLAEQPVIRGRYILYHLAFTQ